MALDETQVDCEERKEAGRQAAQAMGATEMKPVGNTSATVYPFTYWWIVGYNEYVEEVQRSG